MDSEAGEIEEDAVVSMLPTLSKVKRKSYIKLQKSQQILTSKNTSKKKKKANIDHLKKTVKTPDPPVFDVFS